MTMPTIAASVDAHKMAALLWASSGPGTKASCAMNSDIVKPRPASTLRLASTPAVRQLAFDEVALEFQTHQQEEQGHQAIVDSPLEGLGERGIGGQAERRLP